MAIERVHINKVSLVSGRLREAATVIDQAVDEAREAGLMEVWEHFVMVDTNSARLQTFADSFMAHVREQIRAEKEKRLSQREQEKNRYAARTAKKNKR
jgi:hypothetical protein